MVDLHYCAVCRQIQPEAAQCFSCGATRLAQLTPGLSPYEQFTVRVLQTAIAAGASGMVTGAFLPTVGVVSGVFSMLATVYYTYRESPLRWRNVPRLRPARPPKRPGYSAVQGQLVAGVTPRRAPISGATAIATRHDVIVAGEVVLTALGWCEAQLRGPQVILALHGPLELLRTDPPVAVVGLGQATLLVRDVEVDGRILAKIYGDASVEERVLAGGPARVHLDPGHAPAAPAADAPYREGAATATARVGAPILLEAD